MRKARARWQRSHKRLAYRPTAARRISPCGGRALSTPQRQLPSTHQRPIVRGPVSGFVPERKFKFEHLRKLAATGWIHFCNNAVFRFTVVSEGKLGVRTFDNQRVDAAIKCAVLKQMTGLEMPHTVRML